jgi:hypothetical protein
MIIAAFAALTTAGCSTTEGRCEDVCEYTDNCGLDPEPNCVSSCESKHDDASDSCQEAFDEYADCISDNDLECDAVAADCDGAFAKFFTDCAGQLD